MSELDEVSMHIGQLTGQVEALNSNMEHLVSWIKDSHGEMKDALTKHVETDRKDFDELKKNVADLTSFKTRVIAAASVCSIALTALGNFIISYFTNRHTS